MQTGTNTTEPSHSHPHRHEHTAFVAGTLHGFAGTAYLLGVLPAVALPGLGPVLWQALVVPGMADNQLSDFAEPELWPDWPDRYRVQMRYRGFGRALRSTVIAMAGTDLDSMYSTVGRATFPVQLIWGTEDRTVPLALAARVRAAIPRTAFHPIDGAGHLPHMERAQVVNSILIAFLNGR